MTEPLSFRAIPGPGFIANTAMSTWLDAGSPSGPVAWILVGHPPPRRPGESADRVEYGLLGLADGLRLVQPARRLPFIGNRLIIRGPHTVLDYGHPEYAMRLPSPGPAWREHVAGGGNACVMIGLDPIAAGAGPEEIEAYVLRSGKTGRARMGFTRIRPR